MRVKHKKKQVITSATKIQIIYLNKSKVFPNSNILILKTTNNNFAVMFCVA